MGVFETIEIISNVLMIAVCVILLIVFIGIEKQLKSGEYEDEEEATEEYEPPFIEFTNNKNDKGDFYR